MRARLFRGHDAARGIEQTQVQRQHIGLREERSFIRGAFDTIGARAFQRLLARPRDHVHAKGAAVLRHHAADASVAEDAECFAAQRAPYAHLPIPGFHGLYLLRNHPHRGNHQSPRKLGRRVRRRPGMHVRADQNAQARAGRDIDMRIHAALAGQAQLRQLFEKRRANLCPLANENERFGVAETLRECFHVLHVVVPDGDFVAAELLKAIERAQRIVIIIENRDFQRAPPVISGSQHIGRSPFSRACEDSKRWTT